MDFDNNRLIIIVETLYQNMLCIRCQMVVNSYLEKIGLQYIDVKIG